MFKENVPTHRAGIWRVVCQSWQGTYFVEARTDDEAASRFHDWWGRQPMPAREEGEPAHHLIITVLPVNG